MGKTFIKEETLGQRIRAKRKEAGYSQEKLAELLMIKQNTLSKYENDEHTETLKERHAEERG